MVKLPKERKLLSTEVISVAFLIMQQNSALTILCSLRYSALINERMNTSADLV